MLYIISYFLHIFCRKLRRLRDTLDLHLFVLATGHTRSCNWTCKKAYACTHTCVRARTHTPNRRWVCSWCSYWQRGTLTAAIGHVRKHYACTHTCVRARTHMYACANARTHQIDDECVRVCARVQLFVLATGRTRSCNWTCKEKYTHRPARTRIYVRKRTHTHTHTPNWRWVCSYWQRPQPPIGHVRKIHACTHMRASTYAHACMHAQTHSFSKSRHWRVTFAPSHANLLT